MNIDTDIFSESSYKNNSVPESLLYFPFELQGDVPIVCFTKIPGPYRATQPIQVQLPMPGNIKTSDGANYNAIDLKIAGFL